MDNHQSTDALTDAALDRSLEAACAVEPSPGFVARVRTRVQSERVRSWWALSWPSAAAGAIVVVAAVIVGLSQTNGSRMTPDAPVAQDFIPAPQPDAPVAPVFTPAQHDAPVAPGGPAQNRSAPRKAAVASDRRSASRDQPQLLIPAGEARALQQLFSGVRQGLIDLSSLPHDAASAALQPPSDILFQPITFEPIAAASAEEGERQ